MRTILFLVIPIVFLNFTLFKYTALENKTKNLISFKYTQKPNPWNRIVFKLGLVLEAVVIIYKDSRLKSYIINLVIKLTNFISF